MSITEGTIPSLVAADTQRVGASPATDGTELLLTTTHIILPSLNPSDPSMRTSSIKDRPVKVAFNQFHYGLGGMVGTVAAVPAAEETATPQEVGSVGM